MKYWRGYLTAAILLACTWALREFAKAHTVLVDMIYPYVSRMAQNFLANWSGDVTFCLWQALVYALLALVAVSAVLMIVFKWNPVRWGGWVCTALAILVFCHTCVYGLNQFSGSLAEDIRLEETDYTISELEAAAIYYRDQVNALSEKISRDGNQDAVVADFDTLAQQAAEGFETLVYEESLAVFAGPMGPVKKLSWAGAFSVRGITGMTVGLTGEAAVNPDVPGVLMPFAMCREMAKQSSIAAERDAAFAAYMACLHNSDPQFQYSGALMGYRYCLKALESLDAVTGAGAVARVTAQESAGVKQDMLRCDEFLKNSSNPDAKACDLLVSWHIQEIVLPTLVEEEELFDPLDKSQVDLSEHPDA